MLRVKNRTSSPQEKKIRGFICCLGCTGIGAGILFLSALGAGQPGMGGREQCDRKPQCNR